MKKVFITSGPGVFKHVCICTEDNAKNTQTCESFLNILFFLGQAKI